MTVLPIVTCEHGGRQVPAAYASLFAGSRARRALVSHRGYDPGALTLARTLARRLDARLVASEVTRLLVDLNRSEGHRDLFSGFVSDLDPTERERLLDLHYRPYRRQVEELIAGARGQRVVHLSVHSFAPVLGGQPRKADIGLLYDPQRPGERSLSAALKGAIVGRDASLRVRRNYPYRGVSDGLTTAMRRRFAARDYCGVELELNQRTLRGPRAARVRAVVVDSVAELLV